MTTNDRRISALELRLYVLALFAVVYTVSWRAIGAHARPAEATTQPAPVAPAPVAPTPIAAPALRPAPAKLATTTAPPRKRPLRRARMRTRSS